MIKPGGLFAALGGCVDLLAGKAPKTAFQDTFEAEMKGRAVFCTQREFMILEEPYLFAGLFADVTIVEPGVAIVAHGNFLSSW